MYVQYTPTLFFGAPPPIFPREPLNNNPSFNPQSSEASFFSFIFYFPLSIFLLLFRSIIINLFSSLKARFTSHDDLILNLSLHFHHEVSKCFNFHCIFVFGTVSHFARWSQSSLLLNASISLEAEVARAVTNVGNFVRRAVSVDRSYCCFDWYSLFNRYQAFIKLISLWHFILLYPPNKWCSNRAKGFAKDC